MLCEVIDPGIGERMSKDRALTQIRNAGNLPTLPEILVKLLDACDDEEVTLPEIAAIITKDPALSVKVLQLVNSAYNGFRHTFTTIDQAVIYLGASTTKNLAISTSIHQVFKEKKIRDSKLFNTGVFWHHSLLCATIAKRLASLSYNCNPDEAYLAGLLHDCGKILLASTFPDSFTESGPGSCSGAERRGTYRHRPLRSRSLADTSLETQPHDCRRRGLSP